MKESCLEIASRHGRAIAAYLCLPRRPAAKSVRAQLADPGLVLDLARDGRLIAVEITAPQVVTLAALNRALRALGVPVATRADLAPLRAA